MQCLGLPTAHRAHRGLWGRGEMVTRSLPFSRSIKFTSFYMLWEGKKCLGKFVLKKESIFNEWDPSLLLYLRAFEKA